MREQRTCVMFAPRSIEPSAVALEHSSPFSIGRRVSLCVVPARVMPGEGGGAGHLGGLKCASASKHAATVVMPLALGFIWRQSGRSLWNHAEYKGIGARGCAEPVTVHITLRRKMVNEEAGAQAPNGSGLVRPRYRYYTSACVVMTSRRFGHSPVPWTPWRYRRRRVGGKIRSPIVLRAYEA